MKKFGDATLTKWSNLFPVIEKIGIMCPHDMTHVLPNIFSLNQSVLEKVRHVHIEGHLAKNGWNASKMFISGKTKKGGWEPLQVKGT